MPPAAPPISAPPSADSRAAGAEKAKQPVWWLGLVTAYVVFGLGYIYRTSFLIEGTRVWSLWDDGMISMTYASNWVNGHGLLWSLGEPPVQGYTNFGIVLVMIFIHLLPIAKANAALLFQLINLAALVGAVVLSRRLAERLFPSNYAGHAGVAGQLASIGVLCCAPLAIWALQGSDTGLVGLWLVACVYRTCEPTQGTPSGAGPAIWPTALLFSLGPILRLDNMMYVAPLWLFILFVRRDIRLCGAIFAATTFSLFSVLLFAYAYYGDPLPNTYYLKATGIPREWVLERGLESLYRARMLWPLGLLGLLGWSLSFREMRVSLCGGLVLLALGYNTFVGGDWADVYLSRFVVPVLPLLFVLAAGAISQLLQRAGEGVEGMRRAIPLVLFATLCLWINPERAFHDWTSVGEPTMWRDANQRNANLAGRFSEILSPTDEIAMSWAGVLPYFRSGAALDVLGKSDVHIAHNGMDPLLFERKQYKPGHSKTDWEYVIGKRPAVIVDAKAALRAQPTFAETYVQYVAARDRKIHFHLRKDIAARIDLSGYFVPPRPLKKNANPGESNRPG